MPTYRKTTKPKLPIQRTIVAPRFRAKPSKTPAIPLGGAETPGQTAKRVAAKIRSSSVTRRPKRGGGIDSYLELVKELRK